MGHLSLSMTYYKEKSYCVGRKVERERPRSSERRKEPAYVGYVFEDMNKLFLCFAHDIFKLRVTQNYYALPIFWRNVLK